MIRRPSSLFTSLKNTQVYSDRKAWNVWDSTISLICTSAVLGWYRKCNVPRLHTGTRFAEHFRTTSSLAERVRSDVGHRAVLSLDFYMSYLILRIHDNVVWWSQYIWLWFMSASSLSLTNKKKSTFAEQGSFSHNIYFIHPALQWFPWATFRVGFRVFHALRTTSNWQHSVLASSLAV